MHYFSSSIHALDICSIIRLGITQLKLDLLFMGAAVAQTVEQIVH